MIVSGYSPSSSRKFTFEEQQEYRLKIRSLDDVRLFEVAYHGYYARSGHVYQLPKCLIGVNEPSSEDVLKYHVIGGITRASVQQLSCEMFNRAMRPGGVVALTPPPLIITPVYPVHVLGPTLSKQDESERLSIRHGLAPGEAFPVDNYNDLVFVEQYIKEKYIQRVDDLTIILRGLDKVYDRYYVPSDGCGVGFSALIKSGVQSCKIISRDSSSIMVKKGRELGALIEVQTNDSLLKDMRAGDFVLISHFLDYDKDFLAHVLEKKCDVIVFEHNGLYNGYSRLFRTGHTSNYSVATNVRNYEYTGQSISLSARTMVPTAKINNETLIKFASFCFHGYDTIPWFEYLKFIDKNNVYAWRTVEMGIGNQNRGVMREPVLHVCGTSCMCRDLKDVYHVQYDALLTTGYVSRLVSTLGVVPSVQIDAITKNESLRLEGIFERGLYYPIEPKKLKTQQWYRFVNFSHSEFKRCDGTIYYSERGFLIRTSAIKSVVDVKFYNEGIVKYESTCVHEGHCSVSHYHSLRVDKHLKHGFRPGPRIDFDYGQLPLIFSVHDAIRLFKQQDVPPVSVQEWLKDCVKRRVLFVFGSWYYYPSAICLTVPVRFCSTYKRQWFDAVPSWLEYIEKIIKRN